MFLKRVICLIGVLVCTLCVLGTARASDTLIFTEKPNRTLTVSWSPDTDPSVAAAYGFNIVDDIATDNFQGQGWYVYASQPFVNTSSGFWAWTEPDAGGLFNLIDTISGPFFHVISDQGAPPRTLPPLTDRKSVV